MNNDAIEFIEKSKFMDLLKDNNITDISFNGKDVFYMHNIYGRKASNIKYTNEEAIDFIRQVSNLCDKQFSFTNPILDMSIGRYRINALHPSIGRLGNDQVSSFSIRIASSSNRVKSDKKFMDKEAHRIIKRILKNNESIVIGGVTGTGKTELQKYILSLLPENSRIIVIDNIQEINAQNLDTSLDINTWQINENNGVYALNLIKNALRSNPDWLIVAEARGKEMSDVLASAMTGHPIITTLHAKDIDSMIPRIARMVYQASNNDSLELIKDDVKTHLKYYIFLKRKITKKRVNRYIDSIGMVNGKNKLEIIYKRKDKK